MPHIAEDSRPILPPRPTGRMDASEPKRSIWSNWPVIVIVLASLAIAAAVVLMVMPPSGSSAKAGTRKLPPPPAPERMDTNPLVPPSNNGVPPKSSGIDPWGKRPAPNAAPAIPDDPDQGGSIDPDDLAIDPFNPNGGSGLKNPFGGLGGLGQGQFMFAMVDHVCSRAKSCGSATGQAAQMCDAFSQLGGGGGGAPSCASGKRCLAKIDQLDCASLDGDNMLAALALAQDCMEAIQSC